MQPSIFRCELLVSGAGCSIDLSRRKRENKFDDAQASEANDSLLNCYLGTHQHELSQEFDIAPEKLPFG